MTFLGLLLDLKLVKVNTYYIEHQISIKIHILCSKNDGKLVSMINYNQGTDGPLPVT